MGTAILATFDLFFSLGFFLSFYENWAGIASHTLKNDRMGTIKCMHCCSRTFYDLLLQRFFRLKQDYIHFIGLFGIDLPFRSIINIGTRVNLNTSVASVYV